MVWHRGMVLKIDGKEVVMDDDFRVGKERGKEDGANLAFNARWCNVKLTFGAPSTK